MFAQLAPLEQQRGLSFTVAMRAYEQIRRMPNELAKSYHARFLAVGAQLQRLGLTVYADEARALKWLSGLDLPAQEQRNVLTAAGSYDTDRLRAAVELQFGGAPPPSRARPPGKGKPPGKGGHGGRGHHAHQQPQQAADQTEMDAETRAMTETIEALSVTAQRLKHLTQSHGKKGENGEEGDKGGAPWPKQFPPKPPQSSAPWQPPSGGGSSTWPRPSAPAWEQAAANYAAEVGELEDYAAQADVNAGHSAGGSGGSAHPAFATEVEDCLLYTSDAADDTPC
eukprot:4352575-Amphidinium_carterae.1